MSELSQRAAIPTATVKWYIRIGLVSKGESTARNQATYDDSHLRRLRLIRALLEVGGLSVERVQHLLTALDDPDLAASDVAAAAHAAVAGRADPRTGAESLPAVDRYLESRRWVIDPASPARFDLAAVLSALQQLAGPVGNRGASPPVGSDAAVAQLLDPYADAVEALACAEIDGLPRSAQRDELVERIVLGTVLMDRAISALRRLAQESAFVGHRAD